MCWLFVCATSIDHNWNVSYTTFSSFHEQLVSVWKCHLPPENDGTHIGLGKQLRYWSEDIILQVFLFNKFSILFTERSFIEQLR